MKKLALLLLLALGSFIVANAQNTNINKGFGVGYQLGQYYNDFGIGINLTSPCFAKDNFAFRLRGNYMFHEHVKNDETVWTPYFNASFGVVGFAGTAGDFIRLYGEGGILCLLPSDEFSSDNFVMGGYGLLGFEFFFIKQMNYFIEAGGVGTGAKADKLPNKPIYSNGFMIGTGLRMYF